MPVDATPQRRSIKDVFYETRVLTGRDYTVRRFAIEVLGNSVNPVLLGYIEKGKRMPSEALVRRLAAVRKQDPQELLALLLARPHAATRSAASCAASCARRRASAGSTTRTRGAGQPGHRGPAGGRRAGSRWRAGARRFAPRRGAGARRPARSPPRGRATSRPRSSSASWSSCAAARCAAAATISSPQNDRPSAGPWGSSSAPCSSRALLDKLVLAEVNTGTYLRNHYLYVDPEELPEIQRRLDEAVTKIADEFARGAGDRSAGSSTC